MKLWLLSATILFFLFLVFFARQFPRHNPAFAAWLGAGVMMQCGFALLASFHKNWVPAFAGMTDWLGWLLIAVAFAWAATHRSAVNGIIADGLAATVALQAAAILSIRFHQFPEAARTLISNVAGFAPTGYMLVRFTFVDFDLLTARARSFAALRMTAEHAAGYARGMFS